MTGEHGERVSYRDKLAEAMRDYDSWDDLIDRVAAVRDAELDRLSQENDRLAAVLKDLRSSVRTIADRLTDWCHDDTASKTIAGSIAGDLNALAETTAGDVRD